MTDDSQVSVAVVGLDNPYWPTAFADAVEATAGAELVGFTDLDVEPDAIEANLGMDAETYAEDVGVPRLGDLNDALDAADAVFVCTRNTRMPDVILEAVEAGRHVFAAKPIAIDAEQLARIEDNRPESTVVTGGQTGRADPAIAKLREVVHDGRVGDVRTMRVMHQHGRTHEWTAGTWYTDPAEGGPCHWLGWYPLDVATAVLGPVDEIWGHAQQLVDADDPQPDHLKATARHRVGHLSTMEVYCDVDMDWDVAMLEAEIVGSDGVVRYSSPGEAVRLHNDSGVKEIPFEPGEALKTDVPRWIDACRGRGAPTLNASEALQVAAAGCAWNRASQRHDRRASVELRPESDD